MTGTVTPPLDSESLRILRRALRYRRILVAIALVLGLAGAAFFQLRGSYTAEATFVAEESPLGAAGLAGIASQLGVNLPLSAGGRPVDYYVALLRSPQLLVEMAKSPYRVDHAGQSRAGNLFSLYGFDDDTSATSIRDMVEHLNTRIAVTTNRRSAVVSLRVKAPYPALAQQMARRLLQLVNDFNRRSLQSRAAAERAFVGQRLDSAQSELRAAENAAARFLVENRSYENSPRLVLEYSRLQRELETRQQVYLTLMRGHEQARIEEVRNTPVISVLQSPELFWWRSRNPLAMGAGAFVAVLGFGLIAALGLEWLLSVLPASGRLWLLATAVSRRVAGP